ncbi:hypothetical protein BJX96DRAFT_183084 [Aspergillus floccosus]
MATFEHIEDVIGQLPMLKSYTHILLCFPLAERHRNEVVESLESAVRQVVKTFPFLAGKVVNQGKGPNSSGTFKVAPCETWESPDHRFVRVVDRSFMLASYDEIRTAQAPASMLPGSQLGLRVAFPAQYHETESDPAPVMDIQFNLIRGGLLLDIAGQHNIVDASGIFQIANLIALSMRGESIPDDVVKEGNCDRRNLIPLLGADKPLLDHSELKAKSATQNPSPANFFQGYKWQLFKLSAEALSRINAAGQQKPHEFVQSVTFVSPNDCLTAFLWQRVAAMRLKRLHAPEAVSKISRAVDLRRAMGITPAYMGHMIRVANTSLTFQEIVTSSLSRLASLLRKSVIDISQPYAIQSYVTFIANEPDKSKIAYAGAFNPFTDMTCSSIAHITAPGFGRLGAPEFIRRPTYGPLPCSTYVAPENDGYVALMCLHEDEFQILGQDKAWSDLVKRIG